MRPSLFFATSLTFSSHLSRHHGTCRVVRAAVSSSSSSSTRLRSTTTRLGDGTIVISPEDVSRHSASVVLCHGLGDTADGWAEPAQYLANQLPHVKFILPTAPTRPVTMNGGVAMPSWYDIIGLDARSNESCDGLDESMDKILDLLEGEIMETSDDDDDDDAANDDDETCNNNKQSLDYSRLVLAGFSQGGALALYGGMTQRRRNKQQRSSSRNDNNNAMGLGLAGIVVMSGYLPRSKQFEVALGSEHTPILHCHGEADSVVPVQATELSKARVSAMVEERGGGGNSKDSYEVKTYPGLQHSVSMEELNDVAAFLKRVVPPLAADGGQQQTIIAETILDPSKADPAQMSVKELRSAIKQEGLDEQAKGMFEKSELVNLLLQHYLKDDKIVNK